MADLGLLGKLPLELRSIIYEANMTSDKEIMPFPTHKDRLFMEGRKEPVANRLPLGRILCKPLVLTRRVCLYTLFWFFMHWLSAFGADKTLFPFRLKWVALLTENCCRSFTMLTQLPSSGQQPEERPLPSRLPQPRIAHAEQTNIFRGQHRLLRQGHLAD